MDAEEARATLAELRSYTIDVSKLLGVKPVQNGKNSYGKFAEGQPTGAITHYTASNMAVTKKRPYGRLPVLLNRFAPGGTQKVGVHFIVWDQKVDRFNELRARYKLLGRMPGEAFFMGDDEAFWHAGWFNKMSYGIEIRNLGKLLRDSKGRFFWKSGVKYFGRDPIKVGDSWWEPYTWEQMAATLWIHRLMSAIYPIRPERFLGHIHVSSTRIDPGLHFPIHEMRAYGLHGLDGDKSETPLREIPFLTEFKDDPDIYDREDLPPEWEGVSEDALHAGMYRHDWDGVPDELQDDGEFHGNPPLIRDAKEAVRAWYDLQQLGYAPGDKPESAEFAETVRIFQARWKKRKGRRWVQELKITGQLNDETLDKLDQMKRMIDVM